MYTSRTRLLSTHNYCTVKPPQVVALLYKNRIRRLIHLTSLRFRTPLRALASTSGQEPSNDRSTVFGSTLTGRDSKKTVRFPHASLQILVWKGNERAYSVWKSAPIRQSRRRWVWAWVYEEWCRCSGLLRTLTADPWSWGWARWWAAGTWRTCRRPSWSSRCVSSGRRWRWWRIETRRPGSEWGARGRPGAPLLRTEKHFRRQLEHRWLRLNMMERLCWTAFRKMPQQPLYNNYRTIIQ